MDDAPQTLSTSTAGDSQFSIGSAGSILGGNRYVNITNNNGEGTVSANVANATQPDGLQFSSDAGVNGDYVWQYGNNLAGGTALGDLTNGGSDYGVTILVDYVDLGINVDLTVNDGTNEVTVTETATSPEKLTFLYSDFTGVDFATIEWMSYSVIGQTSVDFIVSQINTIPEPTSFALFGLLGLGALTTRRRRK